MEGLGRGEVTLDVLSSRMPGRRTPGTQEAHTDWAGVDDSNVALLEEVQDV